MSIPHASARLALLAALLTPALGLAQEAYTSYDQFTVTRLDINRWTPSGSLERVREISGNALRLVQRDLGLQTGDTGSTGIGFGTPMTNPATITQARVSITTTAVEVSGCTANTTPSEAQARFAGGWFNAGPQTAGSRLNDVIAGMRVYRASNSTDAAGVLRVQGFVSRCTSSDCSTTASLGTATFGTVPLGTSARLQVEWDAANNRFSFSRDGGTAKTVTYTVADSLTPSTPFKEIGTRMQLASCFTGPRTAGYIDATFDAVSVNVSALP